MGLGIIGDHGRGDRGGWLSWIYSYYRFSPNTIGSDEKLDDIFN